MNEEKEENVFKDAVGGERNATSAYFLIYVKHKADMEEFSENFRTKMLEEMPVSRFFSIFFCCSAREILFKSSFTKVDIYVYHFCCDFAAQTNVFAAVPQNNILIQLYREISVFEILQKNCKKWLNLLNRINTTRIFIEISMKILTVW